MFIGSSGRGAVSVGWLMIGLVVFLLLGACSKTVDTPSSPESPVEVLTPPVVVADSWTLTVEDIRTLRELAFAYWQAFNAYEQEKVLLFLEENYKKKQENSIRSDIDQIKMYRIKLAVIEERAPQITGANEVDMLLLMTEPLGTRVIRMVFRQVGKEWKITYAETAE